MDKAIQNIVSHEDLLCVLTSGGVLSVFRKNKMKDGTNNIELLNTVYTHYYYEYTNKVIQCLIPSGENEREISLDSTDLVE